MKCKTKAVMNKLRKEMELYRRQFEDASERVIVKHVIQEPTPEKKVLIEEMIKNKKMKIDSTKLVNTIAHASVPVKKKAVVVIDFIVPPPTAAVSSKSATPDSICQAKNLNGTPCKCRAKIGKFCAKHAP
jgi:hypothetical protein